MSYSIIVHGGAYQVPDEIISNNLRGCRVAVKAASDILANGGCALDAVEAAVRVLEQDSSFDAGRGSVLNEDGQVEVDAMIMDGSTMSLGAVASLKNVANPVSLARQVMINTPHVLLVADGANRFAQKVSGKGNFNIEKIEKVSDLAKKEWEVYKTNYKGAVNDLFNDPLKKTTDKEGEKEKEEKQKENEENLRKIKFPNRPSDTVGAVAIDMKGRIAAATSTGGITGKMLGRVGDSPLVGSGGYANEIAGVSTTGHGESIAKVTLARHVVFLLEDTRNQEKNMHPAEACKISLEMMQKKVNGCGGAISIDHKGRVGFHFTTPRMPHAYIENAGEIVAGYDNYHPLFQKSSKI